MGHTKFRTPLSPLHVCDFHTPAIWVTRRYFELGERIWWCDRCTEEYDVEFEYGHYLR